MNNNLILDKLLNIEKIDEYIWSEKLKTIFDMEEKMWFDICFYHEHEIIQVYIDRLPKLIKLNATHLPNVDKNKLLTRNIIKEVYFLHTYNFEEDNFHEKEFLCIGKTIGNQYFAYMGDSCGTGFGFGEVSKLFLSEKLETIILYITDKQRNIILI